MAWARCSATSWWLRITCGDGNHWPRIGQWPLIGQVEQANQFQLIAIVELINRVD